MGRATYILYSLGLAGALLLCGAGSGLAADSAGASATPPTTGYAISHVALSPDGSTLAYLTGAPGHRVLGVVAAGTLRVIAKAQVQADVEDVEWSDNRHVLITQRSYSDAQGVLTKKTNLFTGVSFNPTTHSATVLLSGGDAHTDRGESRGPAMNVIGGPPVVHAMDGRRTILVYGYTANFDAALFEVDPDTGAGRRRDNAGAVEEADGRYPIREAGYETGKAGVFAWQLTSRTATGSWRTIWAWTGDKAAMPVLEGRGRTDGTVFVRAREADRDHLYEVEAATGERTKVILDGDPSRIEPFYDPRTENLAGYGQGEGGAEMLVFLDPDRQAAWKAVSGAFNGMAVSPVSVSDGAAQLVVLASGPDKAGAFWLVDLAARTTTRIGPA